MIGRLVVASSPSVIIPLDELVHPGKGITVEIKLERLRKRSISEQILDNVQMSTYNGAYELFEAASALNPSIVNPESYVNGPSPTVQVPKLIPSWMITPL